MVQKNAFEQRKWKSRLKFNLGLMLIDLQKTGPGLKNSGITVCPLGRQLSHFAFLGPLLNIINKIMMSTKTTSGNQCIVSKWCQMVSTVQLRSAEIRPNFSGSHTLSLRATAKLGFHFALPAGMLFTRENENWAWSQVKLVWAIIVKRNSLLSIKRMHKGVFIVYPLGEGVS